jgi:stage V sporulation protein B
LSDETVKESSSASDAARAGRGVIYIAFAKFYFMVSGAVLEFRLPTVLGNTVYGAYGVVNSLVSPFNNVLVTGTIQAVSRFSSQKPETARAVQRAGLRMHLYLGLPMAILFAALAPLTAGFFYDSAKTGPIMVASIIIAVYSFYAVFVGTANGRRDFHKQAGLDIGAATLRVGLILAMAMAGFGLMGAIGGWAAAALTIFAISLFVVGLPGRARPDEEVVPLKPMVTFFVGVAVYLILLNFIMVTDQLLLKRLSTEWFVEHGASALAALKSYLPAGALPDFTAIDPAQAADGQVGYYRAVQTLARLSYQAIIAATFVIFPLISRSTFQQDRAATTRYIHTTMRYSLVFATAIAVVLAANPAPMLDLPFQTDYADAGWPALIALSLGNVAFSLFAIVGTILNGAGMTREAILIAVVTLVAATAAYLIAIPMFVPGRELLTACAGATAGAMLLGAVLGGLVLRRKLGAFLPIASAIRVVIAAAVAMAVGRFLPMKTPLGTLIEAAAVGASFLATLVLLREFGREDLAALSRVVKRNKGAS